MKPSPTIFELQLFATVSIQANINVNDREAIEAKLKEQVKYN